MTMTAKILREDEEQKKQIQGEIQINKKERARKESTKKDVLRGDDDDGNVETWFHRMQASKDSAEDVHAKRRSEKNWENKVVYITLCFSTTSHPEQRTESSIN